MQTLTSKRFTNVGKRLHTNVDSTLNQLPN